MPKLTPLYRPVAASALALVLASSLAFAQTVTTEETAEDSPTEGTSDVLEGLSTGEVVSDEPQVGERYAGEKFGDWTMRCIKTENGNDPCEMFQLLNDDEGNTVAQFSVLRLPENPQQAAAGATVIVPLETALQAQLTMKIDEKPAKRFPFAFCDPVGCYSQIALPEDDVEALKKGNSAVLTIVPFPAPDQRVNATLSLSGFTAAYDKVTVIER